MTKWEYESLTINGDTWWTSSGQRGTFDKGEKAMDLANKLGAVDWELAGVASGGRLNSYTLFFKRPIDTASR